MDVDRGSSQSSLDFSAFGSLKSGSIEIPHQVGHIGYGYDFAEEYLSMIEPAVDQLRSNSNPLLALHEIAQPPHPVQHHSSNVHEIDAFETAANLSGALPEYMVSAMNMDDFHRREQPGSESHHSQAHALSLESYFDQHGSMNPSVTITAPSPVPGASDIAIPIDPMDTSSDGDFESSPRREKRKRSNSGDADASSTPDRSRSSSITSNPPAVATSQLDGRLRLIVGQLPPKSRVETQIRLHLKLVDPNTNKPIPHYRYLILDDDMVVPSARRRPKDEKPEDDVDTAMQSTYLRLHCRVITSQDVDSEVHRCVACVMRERRMQARRTKGEVPVDEPEETLEQDKRKILVFHTPKVIDFSSGEATLPVRITCYCRHHKEQHGFGLVASLIDGYTCETLGSTMVGYIMITDDHKSQQRRPSKKQKVREEPAEAAASPPSSSRPFLSVTIPHQDFDDDSSSASGSTSPLPLGAPAFPSFGNPMQAYSAEPSPASPVPQNPFANMLEQSQPFRMGAPHDATSNPTAGQLQPPSYAYYGGSLLSSPDSRSASGSPPLSPSMVSRPTVEKVVPYEGPLSGGLEITILGQSLLPSHRCFFGANLAKISTYWGPTTIVCVLPPSSTPGTVPVFVLPPSRYPGSPEAESDLPGDTNAAFTYKDDSDKQLLELALQLIGMKMTGRIEDAREIAREIVRQSSNPSSPQGGNGSGYSSPGSTQYSKSVPESSKENLVLKALGALLTNQVSISAEGQTPSGLFDLSLQNDNGQTLMHLAILKGYSTLFQLLVRIANGKVDGFSFDVNTPDWNGWTPLHVAAAMGNADAVETLLTECGALAIMNDEVGLLPFEVVDAKKHPELKTRLQKAAKRFENDLATAEQLRQASAALAPASTEDHIISLPSPHSILADPNDDIESAKAANAAVALASSSPFEIFSGSNSKLRDSVFATTALQFMDSINGFWMTYRMAVYISTLVVLVSLALLEVLPYNFRAGAVSMGVELTGSNSGFNPGNKSKPMDIAMASLTETRLWSFYFLARLIVICGILFGILWHNRERLSRRSPIAFAIGVLFILLIFSVGTLYIFDLLPFF